MERDGHDPLVSADWASHHLHDPAVRFVEVDVDTAAYETGHLPGAVGWAWTTQLADPVRRDLASRDAMVALLRGAGIGPDTGIVLYGDHSNWFAAWAYWQLRLFGHADVRILDGGRILWLDRGLPLTIDVPRYAPVDYPLPRPHPGLRAFRDDIIGRMGDPRLALVDVRSPAEFNGEIVAPPGMPETAQRAGHIPGAVSIPWSRTVNEDGTFRDRTALAELYAAQGVTPDKDVVTYCRIGERSSHSWFVLHELLGFERVRNYDGSWTEYGSMVGVPIDNPSATRADVRPEPVLAGR